MKKIYVVKLNDIEEYKELKEKYNIEEKHVKAFSCSHDGIYTFVYKIKIFNKIFYFYNDNSQLKSTKEYIKNRIDISLEEAKKILLS